MTDPRRLLDDGSGASPALRALLASARRDDDPSAAQVEALSTRLRLPVEQANPLQRLNVRDGAFDSLVIDDVAPLLMLPIGLALRQVA